MRALAAGERDPLGVLYVRYARFVRSIVTRVVGVSGSEADDVTQEVFLVLLDKASGYGDSGRLKAFLCGIAVRQARSRRRRQWFRDAILRRFAGRVPGAAAMAESSMDTDLGTRAEVRRALQVLPEPQRQVLLLHVLENLSGEEIARALGVSPNTVWTRLHRARQAMRRVLSADGTSDTREGGAS